tara:strand:- start:20948 stop:21211 length:264 start_codon:yes stop_codon:yes gene_type:complete
MVLLTSCATKFDRKDKVLMQKIKVKTFVKSNCEYKATIEWSNKKELYWQTYELGADTVKLIGNTTADVYRCSAIPLNKQYPLVKLKE